MGALFIFIVAVGIVILQIVMIVKFFQIAADVREIKNAQVSKSIIPRGGVVEETKAENYSLNGELSYVLNGENVVFSDGLSGSIKIYSGYAECSIITDDGYELLYNNKDYAISALHDYLENHIERQDGLYTKRKYNK